LGRLRLSIVIGRRIVIDHMQKTPLTATLTADQLHGALHRMRRTLGQVGRYQNLDHLVSSMVLTPRYIQAPRDLVLLDAGQVRRAKAV